MRSLIGRRGFLARMAALPIVGTGASFFARQADAATAAVIAQIDAAERRCRDTAARLDEGLAAFEASFPRPHFSLLDQDRWPVSHDNERRFFDGEFAQRGFDRLGSPTRRSIATVATLTRDLPTVRRSDRSSRKMIRRLRRRARLHEQRVRKAEAAFCLADLHRAREDAKRDMHVLADAIFARPATTLLEVRAQARMLCAFARAIGAGYAGRFGPMLAANLDRLGEAA